MRPRKNIPKKTPGQRRSRATVDAILQAAAQILEKDGFRRLTTNRVAERAGVSISSLYQYFPNKQALVHELEHRLRSKAHAEIRQAPPIPEGVGLGEVIRSGVSAALAATSLAPETHRAFRDELPDSDRQMEPLDAAAVAAFKRRITGLFVGVPYPDLAYFLWDGVMDGVIHAACAKEPKLLTDPRFAEGISVLLERYLVRR